MAHNLEFNQNKGTHSFFSKKEIAWHGLGQVVQDAKTSDEVIKLANLDYIVEKQPNYARDVKSDIFTRNKESFSTVRTDTMNVLGTVGTKYEVLQNSEAFTFFDDIVGTKEAIFETAGVLGNGERVFITAKLPDHIRIDGKDDIIEQYLLLTNDHTGSESTKITFTGVRVVCNNTLTMALQSADQIYRVRHTKSMKQRMDDVVKMMGLKNIYFEEMQHLMRRMKNITITESSRKEAILNLMLDKAEIQDLIKVGKLADTKTISTRKKNTIYDMDRWTKEGVGQDNYQNTGIWLFNGINGYYNNGKIYTSEENKFDNLMSGNANNIINKSINLILSYE